MQPTGFAESTMNSATSCAVAAVTTNTFLPPVDAVEEAGVLHGGVEVVGKYVVPMPDFFDFPGSEAQE